MRKSAQASDDPEVFGVDLPDLAHHCVALMPVGTGLYPVVNLVHPRYIPGRFPALPAVTFVPEAVLGRPVEVAKSGNEGGRYQLLHAPPGAAQQDHGQLRIAPVAP